MLIHMKGVHIPDHSQEVLSSRAFGVHSCLISLTNCPGLANVTGNHNHHHYSLQFIDVCDGVNLKQAKWSSILVLFFFFWLYLATIFSQSLRQQIFTVFKFACLFSIYLKGREIGSWLQISNYWFITQKPTLEIVLMTGVQNSIWISHVGGKNPKSWAIIHWCVSRMLAE